MKNSTLLLVLALVLLSSCSYFRASRTITPGAERISELVDQNKTFVIHSDSNVVVLRETIISSDSLGGRYATYYRYPVGDDVFPEPEVNRRYKKAYDEQRLLDEVHIYLDNSDYDILSWKIEPDSRSLSFLIDLNDISYVDVYSKNIKKSRNSHILGTIVTVSLSITSFFFIAVATGY